MMKWYKLSLASIAFSIATTAIADTEIKIVYRDAKPLAEWFGEMATKYQAEHPEIKITLAPISAAETDYYGKLSLLLRSDNSIGVVREDTFTLPSNVGAGFYSELPDMSSWEDWPQFNSTVVTSGMVNGKLYGIPGKTDTRGLFYNKNMLKSIGYDENWQPQNWEEIYTVATKIKAQYPDVLPLYFYAGMGEASTMQTFQMLLYGTNDQMYEEGKWVAQSPGMLAAFEFIDKMTREGLSAKPSLATSQQADKTVWEKLFAKDKIGMILAGGWNTSNFNYYHAGRDEAFKAYGFAKMPKEKGNGFTSMSGGYVYSIPELYTDKEAALNFIKFITNKESSLSYFSKLGDITPRKDVSEDETYRAIDPIRVTATKFLDFTHFRPTNDAYPEISAALQTLIGAVVNGSKSPKEAMEEYSKKVQQIVGKENTVIKS